MREISLDSMQGLNANNQIEYSVGQFARNQNGDGKPMKLIRQVQFKGAKPVTQVVSEVRDKHVQSEGDSHVYDEWDSNEISAIKMTELETEVTHSPKKSFASMLHGNNSDCPTRKVNFRKMVNPNAIENSDFELPTAAVKAVQHKYGNSLVGLEQVLEQGPWLIRNIPLILTKCLDAFTSKMCVEAWGRTGFARVLIEVSADKELKQEVIMAIPKGGPKEKGMQRCKRNRLGVLRLITLKTFSTNRLSLKGMILNPQHLVCSLLKRRILRKVKNNGIKLKNLLKKLNEITSIVDPNSDTGEIGMTSTSDATNHHDDNSESEVEEVFVEENPNKHGDKGQELPLLNLLMFSISSWNIRSLNHTPKQSEVRTVVKENNLSVCAILESHVVILALTNVCSKVFQYQEWSSNDSLCTKGMDVNKDSLNKDYMSSVLESVKANSLASKINNIDGKFLPRRYTTYQEPLKDAGSSKSTISNVKDKIKEMRNEVNVNGAAVTIPMEAVKSVNAHFVNTLYGYFIGDRLGFPLVENYVKNTWAKYANTILKKDEIKSVPVWVKMHHVPIVAYSDVGLSLISTQIGKPLMLDSYTSNMCMNSWGRSAYARVLIEIAADVELVKSLVIAIPVGYKEEHTFTTIDIEYEWTPPRCASCHIFNHVSEKCPKLPMVDSSEKVIDDGFIEVKKKKAKAKKKSMKQVEGIRLNKPPLNLQYRRVDKGKLSKVNNKVASKVNTNKGPTQDVDEYITMMATSNDVHKVVSNDQGQALPLKCFLMINVGAWNIRGMNLYPKQNEVRQALVLAWGFNAPLFVEDTSMGSSTLDVTMREFKEFKDVVQNAWMAQISGFYMFRVVKKLKGLKKPIRKLMYDKGNLHANVVRLREELDKVQTDLDSDPSNLSLREKEAATVADFNDALLMEEKFLKQKAKITWLKEGDSNTAYFHKVVKSRVSRHSTEVAKAFINHYEIFLGQPGNTSDFNTDNLFPTTLNESEALNMVRDISSQEVKSTMFSMANDKYPGLDGFTAAFFKDTWDIIGVDVIKAVKEFFTNGRLLKGLNHTIIALIPKVNTPARVTDYRPISCCNVLFKCISKIIANHLKDSLKKLVSPNQSAFVPGRCVSDNILLTQEIMHNYHLDRRVPRCAFKVDIQKAYATVDWDFFTELDLIHLYFADDLFLFAHGDVNSTKVIKDALDDFKDASGLNPNMPKSKDYFCNVINYTKLAILNILPFEEDRLPVKYLGVSLVSSRRLQLIQSVLSSLHVYWSSVFMLPSRVLLDIEQIMRGFLWSQDNMSRGKVKVAWDVICLPKQEGGLGIRRLDHFNKALMVSHVWKILSLKESLWVKWIHVYKLKNRSFWDILYRERLLCGLTSGVLRVLYPTSFHHVTLLELVSTMLPRDGMGKPFSVHNVWDSIRPRDNLVSWCDLVWFHACIQRHAFNMWLIFKQRLRTQDCLRSWEVDSDLMVIAGLTGVGPSLASIITHLMPIAKRKSS
nr:hypothetical protein [Tanacetum cinerariifolium]